MATKRILLDDDPIPEGDIKDLFRISTNFRVEPIDHYKSLVIIDLSPEEVTKLFPMPNQRRRQVLALTNKFMEVLEQHDIMAFGAHTHIDMADLDPQTRDPSVKPGRPPFVWNSISMAMVWKLRPSWYDNTTSSV